MNAWWKSRSAFENDARQERMESNFTMNFFLRDALGKAMQAVWDAYVGSQLSAVDVCRLLCVPQTSPDDLDASAYHRVEEARRFFCARSEYSLAGDTDPSLASSSLPIPVLTVVVDAVIEFSERDKSSSVSCSPHQTPPLVVEYEHVFCAAEIVMRNPHNIRPIARLGPKGMKYFAVLASNASVSRNSLKALHHLVRTFVESPPTLPQGCSTWRLPLFAFEVCGVLRSSGAVQLILHSLLELSPVAVGDGQMPSGYEDPSAAINLLEKVEILVFYVGLCPSENLCARDDSAAAAVAAVSPGRSHIARSVVVSPMKSTTLSTVTEGEAVCSALCSLLHHMMSTGSVGGDVLPATLTLIALVFERRLYLETVAAGHAISMVSLVTQRLAEHLVIPDRRAQGARGRWNELGMSSRIMRIAKTAEQVLTDAQHEAIASVTATGNGAELSSRAVLLQKLVTELELLPLRLDDRVLRKLTTAISLPVQAHILLLSRLQELVPPSSPPSGSCGDRANLADLTDDQRILLELYAANGAVEQLLRFPREIRTSADGSGEDSSTHPSLFGEAVRCLSLLLTALESEASDQIGKQQHFDAPSLEKALTSIISYCSSIASVPSNHPDLALLLNMMVTVVSARREKLALPPAQLRVLLHIRCLVAGGGPRQDERGAAGQLVIACLGAPRVVCLLDSSFMHECLTLDSSDGPVWMAHLLLCSTRFCNSRTSTAHWKSTVSWLTAHRSALPTMVAMLEQLIALAEAARAMDVIARCTHEFLLPQLLAELKLVGSDSHLELIQLIGFIASHAPSSRQHIERFFFENRQQLVSALSVINIQNANRAKSAGQLLHGLSQLLSWHSYVATDGGRAAADGSSAQGNRIDPSASPCVYAVILEVALDMWKVGHVATPLVVALLDALTQRGIAACTLPLVVTRVSSLPEVLVKAILFDSGSSTTANDESAICLRNSLCSTLSQMFATHASPTSVREVLHTIFSAIDCERGGVAVLSALQAVVRGLSDGFAQVRAAARGGGGDIQPKHFYAITGPACSSSVSVPSPPYFPGMKGFSVSLWIAPTRLSGSLQAMTVCRIASGKYVSLEITLQPTMACGDAVNSAPDAAASHSLLRSSKAVVGISSSAFLKQDTSTRSSAVLQFCSIPVTYHRWTHLALVATYLPTFHTMEVDLFVNGVSTAEAGGKPMIAPIPRFLQGELCLGGAFALAPAGYAPYSGCIGQCALFRSPLTVPDIQFLAASPDQPLSALHCKLPEVRCLSDDHLALALLPGCEGRQVQVGDSVECVECFSPMSSIRTLGGALPVLVPLLQVLALLSSRAEAADQQEAARMLSGSTLSFWLKLCSSVITEEPYAESTAIIDLFVDALPSLPHAPPDLVVGLQSLVHSCRVHPRLFSVVLDKLVVNCAVWVNTTSDNQLEVLRVMLSVVHQVAYDETVGEDGPVRALLAAAKTFDTKGGRASRLLLLDAVARLTSKAASREVISNCMAAIIDHLAALREQRQESSAPRTVRCSGDDIATRASSVGSADSSSSSTLGGAGGRASLLYDVLMMLVAISVEAEHHKPLADVMASSSLYTALLNITQSTSHRTSIQCLAILLVGRLIRIDVAFAERVVRVCEPCAFAGIVSSLKDTPVTQLVVATLCDVAAGTMCSISTSMSLVTVPSAMDPSVAPCAVTALVEVLYQLVCQLPSKGGSSSVSPRGPHMAFSTIRDGFSCLKRSIEGRPRVCEVVVNCVTITTLAMTAVVLAGKETEAGSLSLRVGPMHLLGSAIGTMLQHNPASWCNLYYASCTIFMVFEKCQVGQGDAMLTVLQAAAAVVRSRTAEQRMRPDAYVRIFAPLLVMIADIVAARAVSSSQWPYLVEATQLLTFDEGKALRKFASARGDGCGAFLPPDSTADGFKQYFRRPFVPMATCIVVASLDAYVLLSEAERAADGASISLESVLAALRTLVLVEKAEEEKSRKNVFGRDLSCAMPMCSHVLISSAALVACRPEATDWEHSQIVPVIHWALRWFDDSFSGAPILTWVHSRKCDVTLFLTRVSRCDAWRSFAERGQEHRATACSGSRVTSPHDEAEAFFSHVRAVVANQLRLENALWSSVAANGGAPAVRAASASRGSTQSRSPSRSTSPSSSNDSPAAPLESIRMLHQRAVAAELPWAHMRLTRCDEELISDKACRGGRTLLRYGPHTAYLAAGVYHRVSSASSSSSTATRSFYMDIAQAGGELSQTTSLVHTARGQARKSAGNTDVLWSDQIHVAHGLHPLPGTISVTEKSIGLHLEGEAEWVVIPTSAVRDLTPHWRFRLRKTACLLQLHSGLNILVNFASEQAEESFILIASSVLESVVTAADAKRSSEELEEATELWVSRRMSNFDYLLRLNFIAGRCVDDLSQYPVMPWVIADYTSASLDLSDPRTFRDFSWPIGSQLEKQRQILRRRYEELSSTAGTNSSDDGADDGPSSSYHYCSMYSNPAVVLYYLFRLEPYLGWHCDLHDGDFDHANRLFHSVAICWKNVTENVQDAKELVPEAYYLPDMFEFPEAADAFYSFAPKHHDARSSEGGAKTSAVLAQKRLRSDGEAVGDVNLPPWAEGSAHKFVSTMRQALESDYVSCMLHHWIDLVFGVKQDGPLAVGACNVVNPVLVEQRLKKKKDPPAGLAVASSGVEPAIRHHAVQQDMIDNMGQVPIQLFSSLHPARLPPPAQPFVLTTYDPPIGPRVQKLQGIVAISSRPRMIAAFGESGDVSSLTASSGKWSLMHCVTPDLDTLCASFVPSIGLLVFARARGARNCLVTALFDEEAEAFRVVYSDAVVHSAPIELCALSQEQTHLLTSSADGGLALWVLPSISSGRGDGASGGCGTNMGPTLECMLFGHTSPLISASVCGAVDLVASVARDNPHEAIVHCLSTRRIVARVNLATSSLQSPSPTGSHFDACSLSRSVVLLPQPFPQLAVICSHGTRTFAALSGRPLCDRTRHAMSFQSCGSERLPTLIAPWGPVGDVLAVERDRECEGSSCRVVLRSASDLEAICSVPVVPANATGGDQARRSGSSFQEPIALAVDKASGNAAVLFRDGSTVLIIPQYTGK